MVVWSFQRRSFGLLTSNIVPSPHYNRSRIRTAKWTEECFIYTNATNKLQYLVGEQTHTINHTDQ